MVLGLLGLVLLNCRLILLEYFFLDHFLKGTALSLFFLLLEPVQCLGKTFCTLSFAQPRKTLSQFSKL